VPKICDIVFTRVSAHRGDHRQNLNTAKSGDGTNAEYVINVLSQRCHVTCARVVTACAVLRRAVADRKQQNNIFEIGDVTRDTHAPIHMFMQYCV